MIRRRRSSPTDPAVDADRTAFLDAVRLAAPGWFGVEGEVSVEVLEHVRRSSSVLDVLRVRHDGVERDVVVKQALANSHVADPVRPLLSDGYTPLDRLRHEIDALRLVERHVGSAPGRGFRAIHVLGEVPGHTAVAMERITGGSLRDLSLRRPFRPSADLIDRFESAGAWLRAYHEIRPPQPLPALRANRDEVVDGIRVVAEFVTRPPRRRSIARRLHTVARRAELAASRLPAAPTLGLRHDDFAPRNVLVDGDDVVVIDVLARQVAPIHEDLAQFLMWTETTRVWLLTGGRHVGRAARVLGDAALRGYFGAEVPRHDLRVFEVVWHLDRLAAWYEAAEHQRHWTPIRRIAHLFGERATVRRMEILLDQLDAS